MSSPATDSASEPAPAPPEQPNVAIRTRPPSPRRLSRKVLLGGALAAGAVVAFAVMNGLSDTPARRRDADQETVAAAAGPPESIAQAASQYGAGDLPRGALNFGESAVALNAEGETELAPPQDPIWTNAPAQQGDRARRSAPPPPDPQDVARDSPILVDADAEHERAIASAHEEDDGDARLRSRLSPPRSRYEIQAGAVIPAALVTALNSELPGAVIAQVTAPVFDSVTGEHLLIPQGARLIGSYESGVRYGDHRILLVWNRLVLPNGWSINLRGMAATDSEGASGLSDRTDNHLDRLGLAIGLSAIVSIIAAESEDDEEENSSVSQSVGDAAAAQAAQTGSRIVDRDLAVRPTLRVRVGAPVRVLVTQDIRLRPYRP